MCELTFIENIATAGAIAVLHVVLSLPDSLLLQVLFLILKIEFFTVELQQLVLCWFFFFFSSLRKGVNMLKNFSLVLKVTRTFARRRPLDL